MRMQKKWLLFSLTTILCFFIDWYTKYLAATKLAGQLPYHVIKPYFDFVLVYNRGALFSLDPRHIIPGFPLNAFFFVFSIIAMVVIILYFKSLKDSDTLLKWGLTFIMPGALGNLFDRVIHPNLGVVDFIKIGISQTTYWPIFNMADVYVTVGVGLVCCNLVLEEIRHKKNNPVVAP